MIAKDTLLGEAHEALMGLNVAARVRKAKKLHVPALDAAVGGGDGRVCVVPRCRNCNRFVTSPMRSSACPFWKNYDSSIELFRLQLVGIVFPNFLLSLLPILN